MHITQLTNFIAWNRPSLSWTFTASNCIKEAYNASYSLHCSKCIWKLYYPGVIACDTLSVSKSHLVD